MTKDTSKPRIGIIGTGAIGGFYGLMLARAGYDVHFLLRSEFSAVSENGLRLDSKVHGLLTLQPDTEALYLVSDFYNFEAERGVRWNDPKFDVQWPMAPEEISAKDAAWPDFDPEFHGVERLRGLA